MTQLLKLIKMDYEKQLSRILPIPAIIINEK